MTFPEQMKQMWSRLTPRQRTVVGGGTLATIVLLGVMTRMLSTPEYKPLMVGLEPADAQAISTQLAAKKIAFQMTPDGKGINVAADQLDAARLEVASAGTTHSGRMGFELFDKVSWGQTEFDEKVNYQRALEGELERTIATLSDVKSARVHLVLPRASVFLDRERGAKASVTLHLKHAAMPAEELDAISRLVSGAVDNLQAADVAIIDADTNEALGHKSGSAEGQELEDSLTKKLMTTLGPALGPENLRASVNVEYDLSSSEESQDKYDPAVSAVLNSQKTSEQIGAAAGVGGVAGTTGNLPAANGKGTQGQADSAIADDNSQTSTSENATFGVNKTVRHTVSPAGRIRRISAALLVNDATDHKLVGKVWTEVPRRRTPAQLKQIQDLAQAVLGLDPQRGDVISVQNMTFDDGRIPDVPPSALARVREGLADYSGAVRYVAMFLLFALVYALMFRPAQRQLASSMKELGAPVAAPVAELPGAAAPELAAGPDATAQLETNGAQLKKQIAELVHAEPITMTRTVQAWLHEDPA